MALGGSGREHTLRLRKAPPCRPGCGIPAPRSRGRAPACGAPGACRLVGASGKPTTPPASCGRRSRGASSCPAQRGHQRLLPSEALKRLGSQTRTAGHPGPCCAAHGAAEEGGASRPKTPGCWPAGSLLLCCLGRQGWPSGSPSLSEEKRRPGNPPLPPALASAEETGDRLAWAERTPSTAGSAAEGRTPIMC